MSCWAFRHSQILWENFTRQHFPHETWKKNFEYNKIPKKRVSIARAFISNKKSKMLTQIHLYFIESNIYRHIDTMFSFRLHWHRTNCVWFFLYVPTYVNRMMNLCLPRTIKSVRRKNYFRMMHIKKIGLIGGFEYTVLL